MTETIKGGGSKARSGSIKKKRSASTADELLHTALDLFSSRNYAAVSIKEIATSAGVNPALIYYYYESKDHLFRQTIEKSVNRAFEHFHEIQEACSSPPDILSKWLDNHIDLYPVICKLVKISLDYATSTERSTGIDQSIYEFYDKERAVLAEAINQGIEVGLFQAVNAEQVSSMISTYLDGVMVRSLITPEFNFRQAILDFKAHLWQILNYQG